MWMSLKDYAQNKKKNEGAVRAACLDGRLKTARKVAGRWIIDSEEPYPADPKLKDGKYIGWRKKYGKTKVLE